MRLLLKGALVKDKLPPVQLEAAADDGGEPVGRWFSANLSIGTILAVLTDGITLVGSYYKLEACRPRQHAQLDTQQRQFDEYKALPPRSTRSRTTVCSGCTNASMQRWSAAKNTRTPARTFACGLLKPGVVHKVQLAPLVNSLSAEAGAVLQNLYNYLSSYGLVLTDEGRPD